MSDDEDRRIYLSRRRETFLRGEYLDRDEGAFFVALHRDSSVTPPPRDSFVMLVGYSEDEAKSIIIAIEEAWRQMDQSQDTTTSHHYLVPKWVPVAGFGFAAIGILFLMYLIIFMPAPDPEKKKYIDLLIAFCLAASGAFLGGNAAARGSIPFFKDSPVTFAAGGGVGIFVVVYLVLRYSV
jgi:hypothetical protein